MSIHEMICHFVSINVFRKTKIQECPLKSLQHKHHLNHVGWQEDVRREAIGDGIILYHIF